MTLHFRDRRGAALLRYRNRAEITVLMCDMVFVPTTKAIRYSMNTYSIYESMTLNFGDRRGAVSLRNRNRAEITVLMCEMCEQKLYQSGFFFRGRAEVIRYSVNITLVSTQGGTLAPVIIAIPQLVKVIHMFFYKNASEENLKRP